MLEEMSKKDFDPGKLDANDLDLRKVIIEEQKRQIKQKVR